METITPVEAKPSRGPLVWGLLLVGVGLLLLLASLYQWQIWAAPWHFIGPLLLAAMGISSLWRFFSYTHEQALQGVRRRGRLIWGSFWIFISIAWFGHARGWFYGFQFIGKFWPLLLILVGLAKVLDFYRLQGHTRFRFGELIWVFFVILFGHAAAHVPPDLEVPFSYRFWKHNNPFSGPSFTFTEERRFPLRPRKVSITNRNGNVRITRGAGNEVTVQVEKVVYQDDNRKAKEIADQIQLLNEGTTEFSLLINRKELEDRHYRFKTHLEVRVPEKTAVTVDNTYGSVDATELNGQCTISNRDGRVHVEAVQACVEVDSRHGSVSVEKVKGNVKVLARNAEIVLGDITGDVETENSHQSTTLENIHGAARISAQHGQVLATGIDKDVFVEASNTTVKLSNVKGKCEVHNSHRKLQLEDIGGVVKIENTYGDVKLRNLKSAATVEAKHNSVSAEGLRQSITVTGEGARISLDQVEGAIRITTSLRDVEVSSFKGSVEISTRNGEVRVVVADALLAPVRASNENGDIVLRLPETARATLDVQSTSGSITNDLSDNLKITQQGNDQILKGTLNGGGPQIKLQGKRSNIHLERSL